MNDKIKELLSEEIKSEIQNLSNLKPGSQEHTAAIDSLNKLYKLGIDQIECDEKYYRREQEHNHFILDGELREKQMEYEAEAREREEKYKEEQLAEQIKDRYFRIGIAAAEIVLPLTFYAVWMHKGFKFEETGTYTSNTFRNLFNRFKPTKK